ncbi:MAG: respiratory nitrate reductase subunit gamma [Hydrogenobacter sp.]
MMENFLFIALPYVALFLFFGGIFYRLFSGFKGSYRGKWDITARGDLLWTTRSSGFFGRSSIGVASLNMHWGLLTLFIAHVVGFVGGAYGLTYLVDFFRWIGIVGGVMLLWGLLVALWRRISNPRIRSMSTFEDYAVLLFLLIITSLGMYQSVIKGVFGVSYAVGPWLSSILKFLPNATFSASIPFTNKLHIIFALIFFSYFPFTKLVHSVTFPLSYLWRPYINFRRLQALKR